MRIAMICRHDNSGLGTLSREFADHLKPDKILLVQNNIFHNFPERYDKFNTRIVSGKSTILTGDIAWLLEDIDMVFAIETFYDWTIVKEARDKGVKTVLLTMFEMTKSNLPDKPDLFLCPSKLDYRVMPSPKKYLPIPVNTEKLKWRKRDKAKIFIHSASHGGINARKGTFILLKAMEYVKSNIQLIIYSWRNLPTNGDERIEIRVQNFRDYWQLWEYGDVLIYPQDYNGICLPIIEAMSSGLGVITTDIYPFNEYMPKDLLFKPEGFYTTKASMGLMPVEAAKIDPKTLAKKIDEVYNMESIAQYSDYGLDWSKKNNWEVLLPKYQKVLNEV